MTASAAEHFDFIKMLLRSKSLIFRLFCGGLLKHEAGLAPSCTPAALSMPFAASFLDNLKSPGAKPARALRRGVALIQFQ